MSDFEDIPDFLLVTPEIAAQRKLAWERNPPKATHFGYERTPTEIAYYKSIEDERILKRVLDEQRFRIMRERAAAEKAEIDAVKAAAKQASRKYR
jgi:hypothetical protein